MLLVATEHLQLEYVACPSQSSRFFSPTNACLDSLIRLQASQEVMSPTHFYSASQCNCIMCSLN